MTFSMLFSLLGGLGIFLLGMVIMTEHLKKLAGSSLRKNLLHFTRTPLTGAITGALGTAVIQSSSATTVAAVGFVGAGLLTFSNSLGIIWGANIGTTITGWMVALIGFKFSLSVLMLPLIFVGVMLHFFTHNRLAHLGMALAGFGLIFVGIDSMKTAMVDFRDFIDFSQLPADTLWAQLQLLLLGLIFTVITQSSSAGVAVTLTALFSGLIQFEQAAALVIGMDVGTTITSLMAAIGGTVNAKRTGVSHVIYNLITAIFALMLIPFYISTWEAFAPGQLQQHAELALVGFHSLFNLVGVMVILPFTGQFARMVEWLVPESQSYTKGLDKTLLETPELALQASQKTIDAIWQSLFGNLKLLMRTGETLHFQKNLRQLEEALEKLQTYLDIVHLTPEDKQNWIKLVNQIHILDHLQRLHERLDEDTVRAMTFKQQGDFHQGYRQFMSSLNAITPGQHFDENLSVSERLKTHFDSHSSTYRMQLVEEMSRGELDATECERGFMAIRWAKRVSDHLYRINFHINQLITQAG